ncbi:MAG: thiaminase II/PqqC family protein [Solirubrobacteraceae bacterium]
MLPTSGQTLQELLRGRSAQAERLERELAGLDEAWSPLDHPLVRRWLAGELSAGELRAFAAEHYHAAVALADAAARAARRADGLLADQLERYAAEQERAVDLWLGFAAATGWGGSAWYFGEDPLPETVACVSAWCADSASLAEHLVTIWAVESALAPLAQALGEALHTRYAMPVDATRYFARRARRGPDDAAVAQAGLTSLLPVTSPLALVCRAELARRSYLELLDGVARQLSGA